MYAPSHTGVVGNDQADMLANKAPINTTIKMDKQDIMRDLRSALVEEEKVPVERLEENGVERGSGRHSMLTGYMRNLSNQMATGIVSRKTLQQLLVRRTEHLWQCPVCNEVVPEDK